MKLKLTRYLLGNPQVKRRIEKAPQELVDLKNELALWDQQLNTLKRLIPVEVNYNKLIKDDIPAAEQAVQVQEDKLAPAKLKAEEVSTLQSFLSVINIAHHFYYRLRLLSTSSRIANVISNPSRKLLPMSCAYIVRLSTSDETLRS